MTDADRFYAAYIRANSGHYPEGEGGTAEPYCGVELLPHAVASDGSPAPILCDIPLHARSIMHRNSERTMSWRWHDAAGKWEAVDSG